MTDQETTQVIQAIIDKAQEGKAQPFRTILYWSEFKYYRGLKKATKLVIKTLRISSKRLLKSYCEDVIAGISDFNKLLAHLQLLDIIDFYQQDLETIQTMLTEYYDYLGEGNFWYSFFGGRREG
jgi:hypothetical protein